MSNNVNDEILDRAQVCLDYADNHPAGIDRGLSNAIQDGNLDEIRHFVTVIEGMMAQEYFNEQFTNEGLDFDEEGRVATDVY